MKTSKGFTIIELLVVIAIISVLAAIVLVNVTNYINKGRNAGIKGDMSTIATNAAVWFDSQTGGNGTYAGFSASTLYTNPASATQNANGGTAPVYGANTTGNISYCTCTPIYTTDSESGTFCVDSSGYKAVSGTACATRCTNGAGGTNGACQP